MAIKERLELLKKHLYREINHIKATLVDSCYDGQKSGMPDFARMNFPDAGFYSERLKVMKHYKSYRRLPGNGTYRKYRYSL